MKTGKFKGVTTLEAAGVAKYLGGSKLLYRDAPLLNESQIVEVLGEFKTEKCDSVLFDTGAILDTVAYDLATNCAAQLKKKFGDTLKVVIYNAPEND